MSKFKKKSVRFGTKNDDSLVGSVGRDILFGGRGDDHIAAKAGHDHVFGGRGRDTLDGGAGADRLFGGHDGDVITGGAGSDRIYAGHGDDEAVFVASDNIGDRDRYDGGKGHDTLTLSLTRAQYKDLTIQGEMAAFQAFLDSTAGRGRKASQWFTFESLGLTVKKFEDIKVLMDGREVDLRDLGVLANDDTAALGEDDVAQTFATVLSNDDVPNGIDTVRVTAQPVAGALVFFPGLAGAADGRFAFDPAGAFEHLAAGQTQTVTFTYEVADVDGDTSIGTVAITVTGANDAPTVASALLVGAQEDGAAISFDLLDGAADVDGGAVLRIENVVGLTAGLTVASNIVTVDPANTAFQSLAVGETREITVTYDVVDDQNASVAQSATITITGTNDVPTLTADLNEQNADVRQSGNVLANDTDIDTTDTLTVVGMSAETGGTAAAGETLKGLYGSLTIWADGRYDYDADPTNPDVFRLPLGAEVTETFSYTATDGVAVVASDLEITIVGINTTPEAVDDVASGVEDGPLITGDVGVNDIDPDLGAVLSFATDGNAVAGFALDTDGTWTFDASDAAYQYLSAGAAVDVVIPYSVTDEKGARDIGQLTITLTGTNDAPTARTVLNQATETDGTLRLQSDATDPDAGDVLTYTVDTAAQNTFGTVTNNSDGTFNYSSGLGQTLAQGEVFADSFTYTATDAQGASRTARMDIQITGVNDDPTASDIAVSVTELDKTVDISGLIRTVDPNDAARVILTPAYDDVDTSDTLTLSVDAAGTAAGAYIGTDGGIKFDLNGRFDDLRAGESETVSFAYTVTDNHGGTATANVTVDVFGVNRAADAKDDAADGSVGDTLMGNVLDNDVDADAFAGEVLTVGRVRWASADTFPDAAETTRSSAAGRDLDGAYGTLRIDADGGWIYVANTSDPFVATIPLGEVVTETFTYEVIDGGGARSTAQLVIDIAGTFSRPDVQQQSAAISEDASTSIFDVTDANFDPDPNETLSYALTGAVPDGITLSAAGALRVDKAALTGFQGLDTDEIGTIILTYTATNQKGASAQETIVISVGGENDAPEATDITAAIWSQSAGRTLTATLSDIDGDALSVTIDTGGTRGTVVNNGDGTFFYDPNGQFNVAANDTEFDTFQYTVSDGTTSVTRTATVAVQSDAPPDGYDQLLESYTTTNLVGFQGSGLQREGIVTLPATYTGASRNMVVTDQSAADFDKDGRDDNIYATDDGATSRIIIQPGNANRAIFDAGVITGDVRQIETGDFDGNGLIDYAAAVQRVGITYIVTGLNNGGGSFTQQERALDPFAAPQVFGIPNEGSAVGALGVELIAGDFNGDGIDDIGVMRGRATTVVTDIGGGSTGLLVRAEGYTEIQADSLLLFGATDLSGGMQQLDITDTVNPFAAGRAEINAFQTELGGFGFGFLGYNLAPGALAAFNGGQLDAKGIRAEAADLNGDGVDDIFTSAEGYGWSTSVMNGARVIEEIAVTTVNNIVSGHRGAVIADLDGTGPDDVVSITRDGIITTSINTGDGTSTVPQFDASAEIAYVLGNPTRTVPVNQYTWVLDRSAIGLNPILLAALPDSYPDGTTTGTADLLLDTVSFPIDLFYNRVVTGVALEEVPLPYAAYPVFVYNEDFTDLTIIDAIDLGAGRSTLQFFASTDTGSNLYSATGTFNASTGTMSYPPFTLLSSGAYSRNADGDILTTLSRYTYDVTDAPREGVTYSFALDVSDPDSPPADIFYEMLIDPALGTVVIDQATGEFTWTPGDSTETLGENQTVDISFVYRPYSVTGGTESYGNPTVVTLRVTGENDAPVAEDVTVAAVHEDDELTGTFAASDIDADDDVGGYRLVGEDANGQARISIPSRDDASVMVDLGYVQNNGNGTFTIVPGDALERYDTREISFDYYAVDTRNVLDQDPSLRSNVATVTGAVIGEWEPVALTETFQVAALARDTGTDLGLTLSAPDLVYDFGTSFDETLWEGGSIDLLFDTVTIPGASLDGDISGYVGLVPTFDISPGEIDATFDLDVTTFTPPALVPGETFAIQVDWTADNKQIVVEDFDFDIGLDLVFGMAARVGYDLFGESGDFFDFRFDESIDLLALLSGLADAKDLYSQSRAIRDSDTPAGTFFEETVEIGGQDVFEFELIRPEGFTIDGFDNSDDPDSQRIANFGLDLDGLMSFATGVPLSAGFDIGNDLLGANLSLELLDIDLNFGLNLTQEYTLDITDMPLMLVIEDDPAQTYEIVAGEYFEFELAENYDYGEKVDYDITFDPQTVLSTLMGVDLVGEIEFGLLGLSGGLTSLIGDVDFDIFDGFLVEEVFPLFEVPNFATLVDAQTAWDDIVDTQLAEMAAQNLDGDLTMDIATSIVAAPEIGDLVDLSVVPDPEVI